MSFIMSMEPDAFFALIEKAAEKSREAQAREEWLAVYPWMNKETFVPFEQFYQQRKASSTKTSWRPKEEILAEAEEIRRKAGLT